jgi:hypothetical protein
MARMAFLLRVRGRLVLMGAVASSLNSLQVRPHDEQETPKPGNVCQRLGAHLCHEKAGHALLGPFLPASGGGRASLELRCYRW